MSPESLKLNEGAVLIRIMRRKAEELNRASSTTDWTLGRSIWSSGPAQDN